MRKITSLVLLLLVSCANKYPPLKKVEAVDIPRFMGPWYVIANIPTFIEKEGTHAVETYRWNEKEQRIDVTFTQMKNGEKKEYTQKAWVMDPSGNEWRIQFFWPLKFPYMVIDLAPDYSYTVIGVPNRNYVWIMARAKTISDKTYTEIVERLKHQHFDTEQLEKVPQH
jgi:apolipoprotein D and lipocalin family protein